MIGYQKGGFCMGLEQGAGGYVVLVGQIVLSLMGKLGSTTFAVACVGPAIVGYTPFQLP